MSAINIINLNISFHISIKKSGYITTGLRSDYALNTEKKFTKEKLFLRNNRFNFKLIRVTIHFQNDKND